MNHNANRSSTRNAVEAFSFFLKWLLLPSAISLSVPPVPRWLSVDQLVPVSLPSCIYLPSPAYWFSCPRPYLPRTIGRDRTKQNNDRVTRHLYRTENDSHCWVRQRFARRIRNVRFLKSSHSVYPMSSFHSMRTHTFILCVSFLLNYTRHDLQRVDISLVRDILALGLYDFWTR